MTPNPSVPQRTLSAIASSATWHASSSCPAQWSARASSIAISAAPEKSPTERSVAYGAPGDGYGLIDPPTIVVLFNHDQARPPLDFSVGDMASDGLGRYVLMPDHTEIVTLRDNQIVNLTDFAARLAR